MLSGPDAAEMAVDATAGVEARRWGQSGWSPPPDSLGRRRRLEPLELVLDAHFVVGLEDIAAVCVDTPHGRFLFSSTTLDVDPQVKPGERVILLVQPDGCLQVRESFGGT